MSMVEIIYIQVSCTLFVIICCFFTVSKKKPILQWYTGADSYTDWVTLDKYSSICRVSHSWPRPYSIRQFFSRVLILPARLHPRVIPRRPLFHALPAADVNRLVMSLVCRVQLYMHGRGSQTVLRVPLAVKWPLGKWHTLRGWNFGKDRECSIRWAKQISVSKIEDSN